MSDGPRTPTTAGARRTRERVLDAALELFNTSGSAAVTTNHIAAHAEISPGNLYYWFRDKNEIVHELYTRLAAEHEAIWEAGEGDPVAVLSPPEVLERLAAGAELSRTYSFFARDLLGLLHADPVLAARYTEVRTRRLATFAWIASRWRADGIVRPISDQDLADLVQSVWIVAEAWFAFVELDDPDPAPEVGARLLRVVLAPYLT